MRSTRVYPEIQLLARSTSGFELVFTTCSQIPAQFTAAVTQIRQSP